MALFIQILLFYGLWVPKFSFEIVIKWCSRIFHCLFYVLIDPNCEIHFLLTCSFMNFTNMCILTHFYYLDTNFRVMKFILALPIWQFKKFRVGLNVKNVNKNYFHFEYFLYGILSL